MIEREVKKKGKEKEKMKVLKPKLSGAPEIVYDIK